MKKIVYPIIMVVALLVSVASCKDESKLERLEDKLEQRSDDLEDASDYIGDAEDDMEEAIENFRKALETIEDPEDRAEIRKRLNDILDAADLQ